MEPEYLQQLVEVEARSKSNTKRMEEGDTEDDSQ